MSNRSLLAGSAAVPPTSLLLSTNAITSPRYLCMIILLLSCSKVKSHINIVKDSTPALGAFGTISYIQFQLKLVSIEMNMINACTTGQRLMAASQHC